MSLKALPKLSLPLSVFTAGRRPALPITLTKHLQPSRPATTETASSLSRRRAVTVVNDTGAVPWKQLSYTEKAARTTQQTFNFGLVLLGLVATGGVATVLYLEVFATDSKTAIFNRSADLVRGDAKCRELLAGSGEATVVTKRDIKAYGEPSWSRWARNRTIASRLEKDRAGGEHLHMHFYVEGPSGTEGTVRLEMVRRDGREFEYYMLALDVPGNKRHFLVDKAGEKFDQRKQGRMFGVSWNR